MIVVKEIIVTLGIVFSIWLAGAILGYGFACGLRAGELKFKMTIKESKSDDKIKK